MNRIGSSLVCAGALATAALLFAGRAQAATSGISLHVEGGFGSS
jgi:hypothetical protein